MQEDNIGVIGDKSKRLKELLPNATINPYGGVYGDIFANFFGGPPPQKKKPASTQTPKTPPPPAPKTAQKEVVEDGPISKQGMFSAGQFFDAKRIVRDLFAEASREIIIIDGYVGEDVLSLLTVKRDGVHVKLLTGKASVAFTTLAKDFNRQYKNLEIRSSKTFHDRFIFIDDRDFYHFGASLEHLGNKAFMFSKLEESSIVSALKTQWAQSWAQGVLVL